MPELASQRLDVPPDTAGLALARAISIDQIVREIAHQARHAVPGDAAAVALADDDPATLRLRHQLGYGEDDAELRTRLAPQWAEALATGGIVVATTAAGAELTVPLANGAGVRGALTVRTGATDAPRRRAEWGERLGTLAARAAVAVERVRLAEHAEHERRLAAVGRMAGGVAHELRTPLAGIAAAAQLLRFRAREDPVVEKNVGRILRELEHLNRLATALLDYADVSAPQLAPGDPDRLWDEVLAANRGLLESRALVVQRVRAEPPARCPLDAGQIVQLFSHVLVNAMDAAPEASDLTLTSTVLPDGAWRCRLHDAGPGIPEDVLARVFDVCFTTKPGGTGLGLPLCQRLAEAHRGTIALASAPGAGTTVTIVLPGETGSGTREP